MAKFKLPNIKLDFNELGKQFQGLQGRHPGLWPKLPKFALLFAGACGLLVVAYFLYWQGQLDEYAAGQARGA
jgi:type IV pilus assembly protein PilO